MGTKTKIEWTDHTFNPWIGCTKIAAGCQHCYAADIARRFKMAEWGPDGTRKLASDRQWAEVEGWQRSAAKRGVKETVFCASMADVFEYYSPDPAFLDDQRERLWSLIDRTPNLTWMLLTKRPGNIDDMIPAAWDKSPQMNVWIGVSVSTQEDAGKNVPTLHIASYGKCAGQFLSAEPLLEPVAIYPGLVDWVIVGGESGPGARPFHAAWAESVLLQCREGYHTKFFFKQRGDNAVGDFLRVEDVKEFPIGLHS